MVGLLVRLPMHALCTTFQWDYPESTRNINPPRLMENKKFCQDENLILDIF